MIDKRLLISVAVCMICMLGCAQSNDDKKHREMIEQLPQSAPAKAPTQVSNIQNAESQRFIAVRHDLFVETPENELKGAWESIGEFCQTIHCEIMASTIRQNSNSPPSASLSLRVAPEETKQLIEQVGKVGKIVEHRTASDDKTNTFLLQ